MNWLRSFASALLATFRNGPRLWWLAPLIPLFAFFPVFAQHVAEIKLGMFASPEAFKALQNDLTRWAFGYAKIAGLFLAIFASARYWSLPTASRNRWWDLRNVAWRQLLLGIALNLALSAALYLLKAGLSATAFDVVNVAVSLASLPVMVFMLGALFGDQTVNLRSCYRTGWLQGLAMAAFFLLAMVPPQFFHRLDHTLAMSAPTPAIWALMLWDAVLVSFMACWAGAGLAAGYGLGRDPRAPEAEVVSA